MTIRSIGEVTKGRKLNLVPPGASLREACDVLSASNVGALAVMEGDRIVGILSERDVIRRAICKGRPTSNTKVIDVMTPNPECIPIQSSLSDAMRKMLTGNFRHLPVVAGGEVVAMLSMRDIPTEYRLMVERYDQYVAPVTHRTNRQMNH